MNTALAVYDFYDDHGAALQGLGLAAALPDFVKTAEAVDRSAHNNQFAVVMLEDGDRYPRYPVNDKANTYLSALYFSLRADELPADVVKVAAAHLQTACEAHGIDVPTKVAEYAPVESLRTNVVDVSKTGPVADDYADVEFEDVEYLVERADGSADYPIRNAVDVQEAQKYFGENAKRMQPRERREFAVKVAHAAEQIGIDVSSNVADYAGDDFGSSVRSFVDARQTLLVHKDDSVAQELTKLAAQIGVIPADQFAAQLESFDIRHGLYQSWDRHVADPWYSTFFGAERGGLYKEAKGDETAPTTFQAGTTTVTSEELMRLCERGHKTLTEQFGETFANAFRKDPIIQFKAAPLPLKKHLASLATEVLAAGTVGN